jgi:hypothetical protein
LWCGFLACSNAGWKAGTTNILSLIGRNEYFSSQMTNDT